MDTASLQLPRIQDALPQTDSPTRLITCSLCLRVLLGSEWLDAARVISEMRSYELDAPPRLEAGVCDVCAGSIHSRRVVPIAA